MQPERWQQIEEIFQRTVDSPPQERTAILNAACGADFDLRAEIESLLASYQTSGMTAAVFQDAAKILQGRAEQLTAGRKIGPYRVIREIGSGGMGSVYLAARADEAFQKLVAIKIIRRGLDTEEIIQRFRGERQILASLDHPNIARLVDGGSTEDGPPYFVMDYIEGKPVDEYCDEHRLNITSRLNLFQSVCGAVRYAHQNLVVHRDIKAGNVLVTKDGVPKLLDFGIAKLLSPGSVSGDQTLTMMRPLTPEYASPEQVTGGPITTAADVYSLGVLLYRLLTGHSPYRSGISSAAEIQRAIREEEPERPSAVIMRDGPDKEANITPESVARTREGTPEKLRRRLQGDLDNIALMALRKEPARRYASAEQFSEDIGRHLGNLPVMARRDTAGYRAARFVTRHKAGVAAISLLVLSLAAGVLATSWQARVARSERAVAQQQFNDVRNLATSFLFEFNSSIQNLPGATPARQLLVQRALEYLSKLSQQARGDAGLQRDLVEAYLKVGDLQGNPYEPNLGDAHGAQDSYEKALAISTDLVKANPKDAVAGRYLARSYQSLGEVLPLLGKARQGANNIRRASEIFQGLLNAIPHDRDLRVQTANCYESLADLLGHGELENLGDRQGALENYRKSLAIFDAMAADDEKDLKAKSGGAVLRIRVGDMLEALGDLDAAIEYYRAALPRAESIAKADPKNERFLRVLAFSSRKLADAEGQQGDFKLALRDAERASEINQQLANADRNNAQAQANLVLSLRAVADLLDKTGDEPGSAAKYHAATAILEKLSAAAPSDVFIRGQLGDVLVAMGAVLERKRDLAEARRATSRGLAIEQELASRAAATADELSRYALALLTCQPANLREPRTALAAAEQAVEKSAEKDPKTLDILAQGYFQNGDSQHAIEAEEKAIALLAPLPVTGKHSIARQHLEAHLATFRARAVAQTK
jgi:eukaryotic-like serine/threonine-protein kinase